MFYGGFQGFGFSGDFRLPAFGLLAWGGARCCAAAAAAAAAATTTTTTTTTTVMVMVIITITIFRDTYSGYQYCELPTVGNRLAFYIHPRPDKDPAPP